MTPEERAAKFCAGDAPVNTHWIAPAVLRAAAAKEREECAALVERLGMEAATRLARDEPIGALLAPACRQNALQLAAAIRARGA
jgi:hypothetical protein